MLVHFISHCKLFWQSSHQCKLNICSNDTLQCRIYVSLDHIYIHEQYLDEETLGLSVELHLSFSVSLSVSMSVFATTLVKIMSDIGQPLSDLTGYFLLLSFSTLAILPSYDVNITLHCPCVRKKRGSGTFSSLHGWQKVLTPTRTGVGSLGYLIQLLNSMDTDTGENDRYSSCLMKFFLELVKLRS